MKLAPPTAARSAVLVQGLTKRYGQFTAVKDLNLESKPGEILGFLGLNGAGKTTTIRILLDLIRPSSGKAFIFGYDCQTQGLDARAQVGYLPGELGIYSDLTGRQVLRFLGGLAPQPISQDYLRQLQARLELPDRDLDRRLREYSTGMKRKLGLLQAFQADPALLVLDEPSEGLDPLMQQSLYELLAELRQRGRTVFMSSHVLSEVERVCDRVALLAKGQLVLLATVDEIRRLAPRAVRVAFQADVKPPASLPAGHEAVEMAPRAWNLRVSGPLGPFLGSLHGLPVTDLEIEAPRLEDVLVNYYREDAP